MDTEQLLAAEETPALGRSRADVLDMLRAADGPLGVREVAHRMGLHPNTARFHLEALTGAGLARREAQDRETPGCPGWATARPRTARPGTGATGCWRRC